ECGAIPGGAGGPATIASIASRPPMAARLPVVSTNRIAASTLGPMDPAANRRSRRWLGRRCPTLRCSGCATPELALLGCGPAGVDAVDVGGHDVQVGSDLATEQLAGEVLVDHGLDTD